MVHQRGPPEAPKRQEGCSKDPKMSRLLLTSQSKRVTGGCNDWFMDGQTCDMETPGWRQNLVFKVARLARSHESHIWSCPAIVSGHLTTSSAPWARRCHCLDFSPALRSVDYQLTTGISSGATGRCCRPDILQKSGHGWKAGAWSFRGCHHPRILTVMSRLVVALDKT